MVAVQRLRFSLRMVRIVCRFGLQRYAARGKTALINDGDGGMAKTVPRKHAVEKEQARRRLRRMADLWLLGKNTVGNQPIAHLLTVGANAAFDR